MGTESKYKNKKEKDEIRKLELKVEMAKLDLQREKSRNSSQKFSVFCKYIPWISLSIAITISIYFLAGKTTVFDSNFLADVIQSFLNFGDKGIGSLIFISLIVVIIILFVFLMVFIFKNYKKGKMIKKMEKNREEIENINQKEEKEWFGFCFL